MAFKKVWVIFIRHSFISVTSENPIIQFYLHSQFVFAQTVPGQHLEQYECVRVRVQVYYDNNTDLKGTAIEIDNSNSVQLFSFHSIWFEYVCWQSLHIYFIVCFTAFDELNAPQKR